MKKQSIDVPTIKRTVSISLLVLFFAGQASLFAMSPAQLQGKIQDFNRVLGAYRAQTDQGRGLTSEAEKLKVQAEAILNEIRPYTTVAVFESSLRAATTRAQEVTKGSTDQVIENLLGVFGSSKTKRNILSSFESDRARYGGTAYLRAQGSLLENTYDVLAKMYPTKSSGKTDVLESGGALDEYDIERDVLQLGAGTKAQSILQIKELSNNGEGGAFYWMNEHMNNVFIFMNTYGDTKGKKPYGKDKFKNFIQASAKFDQEFVNIANEIYSNLYSMKDESSFFGHLYKDMKGYNLLIQFLTGYKKEDKSYNPSVGNAFKQIESAIEGIGLSREETFKEVLQKAKSFGEDNAIGLMKNLSLSEIATKHSSFNAFTGYDALIKYLGISTDEKINTLKSIWYAASAGRMKVMDNGREVAILSQVTIGEEFQAAYDAGKAAGVEKFAAAKKEIIRVLSNDASKEKFNRAIGSGHKNDFSDAIKARGVKLNQLQGFIGEIIALIHTADPFEQVQ